LIDTEIRRSKPAEKSYKLSDGGGLHILVTPSGGLETPDEVERGRALIGCGI